MRHSAPVLLSVIVVAMGFAPLAAAQPTAAPTIHRVTVHPDTGVLTVTGTGLGPDLQVTVDGQPVPQLPGATDTQMEVLAPVTVVTQPGTYRLTVVDPMRRVGDGFVVVSPTGRVPMASEASPARVPADRSPVEGEAAASRSVVGPADTTASRAVTAASPLTVIEDSVSPYRTAIGHQALVSNTAPGLYNTASGFVALQSNTTGSNNTASGYQALAFNTTGFNNTASGAYALVNNTTGSEHVAVGDNAGANATTGSYNIFLGADVTGTAADTHTIRIGLPYSAGIGQNQTFIAGIWGTQLTGTGAQVMIDANGQLGVGTPVAILNSGAATTLAPAGLEQRFQEQQAINAAQQATNAELQATNAEIRQRSQVQQATIDDLLARIARLEAAGTRRR